MEGERGEKKKRQSKEEDGEDGAVAYLPAAFTLGRHIRLQLGANGGQVLVGGGGSKHTFGSELLRRSWNGIYLFEIF